MRDMCTVHYIARPIYERRPNRRRQTQPVRSATSCNHDFELACLAVTIPYTSIQKISFREFTHRFEVDSVSKNLVEAKLRYEAKGSPLKDGNPAVYYDLVEDTENGMLRVTLVNIWLLQV